MAHSEQDSDPQKHTAAGERLRVARIGKPHGIRGEVTVQLYTDEPAERLAAGAQLIREPGAETQDVTRTTLTVGSQRWNKRICLLGFEEISDRNAAEALRGSVLFIDVAEEAPDDDQWYSHQLEGFSCVDGADQPLGAVSELIPGPAQDLLVVDTAAGEQVMVPFVDELVPEIDAEARTIRLNPPAGLFP